jgi:Cu2+-exporting ATPase
MPEAMNAAPASGRRQAPSRDEGREPEDDGRGEGQEAHGHGDAGGDHDQPAGHDHGDHHQRMIADFRRRFWVSLVLTIPILALSPTLQAWLGFTLTIPYQMPVLGILATAVYLYGGWPFLTGLAGELGERRPGMMTLIAVAITVAWAYSAAVVLGVEGKVFFWELATLILVMLAGHWIEMRSLAGASQALEALAELMPDEARRLDEDGNPTMVAVADLRPGDQVLVRPGEKVPADGRVSKGASELDQSMVTGETRPVDVHGGDEVIAGTVNGSGALTVEVAKTGEDSYLSQVMHMVEEAQQSRSRSQRLADRAAFWLTLIALSVGALTLAVWLVLGREFVYALERSVTVMVITCPHALGLAVPLVVAASTGLAATAGLLIRDRAAFERARGIDTVVFDKTGTLTEGRFEISELISLGGEDGEILPLAAAVEKGSEHPIARAIEERAGSDDLDIPEAEGFEALSGRGARAIVAGAEVQILSPGGLEDAGLSVDDERVSAALDAGKTVVFVTREGKPMGAIALDDVIRPSAFDAIARLKERGIRCVLLTGDNGAVARRVAEELGMDEYRAEVLPDEKAKVVRSVRKEHGVVAMVGDGINDAPALAEADVGIAIGAGTDVALEAASVVLVRDDPADVPKVIALARTVYRKMIQNLAWASGYNVVAIPLAAGVAVSWGVVLSPAAGAVLMSLSTVIVAINARLMKAPAGDAS